MGENNSATKNPNKVEGYRERDMPEETTTTKEYFKCFSINKKLIPFKAYYMFFFSGLGSLIPFETLYFKQLWLSAAQVGFLFGVKPFAHFCAAPLWSSLADKYNKRKTILLIAISFWTLTNLLLGFLPPAGRRPQSCISRTEIPESKEYTYVEMANLSSVGETISNSSDSKVSKRHLLEVTSDVEMIKNATDSGNVKIIHKVHIIHVPVETTFQPWIPNTFILAFFILAIGHIVAAPTQTLANTATLETLENDIDQFGFQRCFGAFGWGIASFAVGLLLSLSYDNSLRCIGTNESGINYRPCLYVSAAFLFASLLFAMLFKTKETDLKEVHEDVWLRLQLAMSTNVISVILLALYCGALKGTMEAFLFWHLQEMGATQVLLALIALINSLGEMCGFLSAQFLIQAIGHIRVMYMVLIAYSLRYLFFFYISNPWFALAIEWIKGLTFSVFWATCVSYLGLMPGATATLQSFLHGSYWGLGYSLGPIFAGLLISHMGTRPTFLSFSFFTIIVLASFSAGINLGTGKTSIESFFDWGYDKIEMNENQKVPESEQSDYDF